MNKYRIPKIPINVEINTTAVISLISNISLMLNILLNTSAPEYRTTGKKDTTYVNMNSNDTSLLVKVSNLISIKSDIVSTPYLKYLGKNTRANITIATAAVTSQAITSIPAMKL